MRQLIQTNVEYDISLYTTLEPCLMCLGIAVLHRVNRIIIACPDPHGGATNLNPNMLGSFYKMIWPRIDIGLMKEPAIDLLIKFLKTKHFLSGKQMLEKFYQLKSSW